MYYRVLDGYPFRLNYFIMIMCFIGMMCMRFVGLVNMGILPEYQTPAENLCVDSAGV